MDKCKSLLRAEAQRFLVSLIVIRSVEHDIATVAARSRDLDQRRRQGHDDSRPDTKVRSMVGNSLRVIARRGRYHSLRPLFHGEAEKFVQCTPFFIRARSLPVL